MKTLLLDIDALFDTRLGTLSQLDPEAAKLAVSSEAYWLREHDHWERLTHGRVSNAAFDAAYAKRDVTTLQASMITGIFPVLLKILAEYQQVVRDGMVKDDIALEINVYPYELSAVELDEMTVILREMLYSDLPIDYSSRSPDELTPEVLDQHYSAVIWYDFPKWLRLQGYRLTKHRCYGLSLVAPKRFEKDPSELSLKQKKQELLGIRLLFLEFIAIEFIDAACFSLFRPDETTDKKEDTAQTPSP